MSISPAIFTPDDNGDQFLNGRFFRSSGLLWKINHDILHPLGLALGVGTAGADGSDDSVAALFRIFVSDDGTWEFTPEANAVKAADWDMFVHMTKSGLIDFTPPETTEAVDNA